MRGQYNTENIVISAFGAVTPLGSTYEAICHALKEGISGIKPIEKFNCTTFTTQHAGVPDEGNALIHWPSAQPRFAELVYAEMAAKHLLAHSGFPKSLYDAGRIGCIVGVDEPAADVQLCLKMKADKKIDESKNQLLDKMVRHFKINDCLNLEPSSVLSAIYKMIPFAGFSTTHVGLCSASLQAIGMGMRAIQQGKCDAMIVGGISGKVNPINLARLELMDVISTDLSLNPEQRSRPFDKRRSGFVLAEGAVLFLIEKESEVLARGDQVLLRLLGYGASLGAEHIVAPHHRSLEMKLAMKRALENSALTSNDIDLINVHGTSTILNDQHESEAVLDVFENNTSIPATANKSLHGHLIATAGAMEVLNTLIALNEGFIPGSINCDEQDEACAINLIKKTQFQKINRVLKNSFGMGGLAASMVLGARHAK